ncbi:hypothetical protein NDU88_010807 [Pleurodeles waltl]|uniref:Uncharacterized protein n=1 Tax=Pleurodeles waltl TaxID=8319 RepID=A0AAV7Q194_PLEWA|nr:hypothetical protein NDU88_010807 [Pleurodeles waltl]
MRTGGIRDTFKLLVNFVHDEAAAVRRIRAITRIFDRKLMSLLCVMDATLVHLSLRALTADPVDDTSSVFLAPLGQFYPSSDLYRGHAPITSVFNE